MIKRKKTRLVNVGTVKIGNANPLVIQSMTKVFTTDVYRCIRQVEKLVAAGCGLVRIAVPTRADTEAFAKIVQRVSVPLAADIHFSAERAVEAIEAGAAKIRLNPGNIKNRSDILRIIDCAKMHRIAVRIGVNEASIRDLRSNDTAMDKRVALMLKEMKKYIALFEKRRFTNLVLSAKSSDTTRTIEVNRAISRQFDYPIHIGLTHAGLAADAAIPSAVAIGTLLAEGIGDTIRVSLAGDPVREAEMAKDILSSLGLYSRRRPHLTVCPTCGRCSVNVIRLAGQIRKSLGDVEKPLRIAVMGCIVNGPGEAADADIAVCAAASKAFIYRNGKKTATVPAGRIIAAVAEEIEKFP